VRRRSLPWTAVEEQLDAGTTTGRDVFTVLGTVTPDGSPHAAPVGAMWINGTWHVVAGPGTRKARNLAHNPACTVTARIEGFDVVVTGHAQRVTNHDELEQIAAIYRNGGWPAEVEGEAFTAPYTAPSGGPPPWNLYCVTTEQAVAVTTAAPLNGATKWTFT
jgi:nitroimidazol reductase NimA-like FMN-containing flavoprotein (pyridoxamine 5'-phosphate oxidase superfamily)